MPSLSICKDLTPSPAPTVVPGDGEPAWIHCAGHAAQRWSNARLEDWNTFFVQGTPMRIFITPRGVVGFYHAPDVAISRRNGRIFGHSKHKQYFPKDDIELPHIQLDCEVSALVGLLTQPHAPLLAPNERIYVRTNHDVQHVPQIAESLWGPLVPAGTVQSVNLYYSEANTVTNLHYDVQSGAIQQLKGRKRVLLFPRDDRDKVPMYPNNHILGRRSQLDMEITEATLQLHPQLRRLRGYECILEPDQCLYIPAGWLHYVESLDTPTVSLIVRYHT